MSSAPIRTDRRLAAGERTSGSGKRLAVPDFGPATGKLRILVVRAGRSPRSPAAPVVGWIRSGLQARGHVVDEPAGHRWWSSPRKGSSPDSYDVVHVHGETPTIQAAAALVACARRGAVPILYTQHVDSVGAATGLSTRHRESLLLRLAQRCAEQTSVAAVGCSARARVWMDAGADFIPFGIDAARAGSDTPRDAELSVLCETPISAQDFDVVLRAVSQVHGSRLLLTGIPPETARARANGSGRGVQLEIHAEPSSAERQALRERARVLVLPGSSSAASGVRLLEAMQAGCVPVVEDITRFRSVVGRIGFTYSHQTVPVLVDALRFLRDHPRLTEDISQRVRAQAAAFTWQGTLAHYERLLLDVAVAPARLAAANQVRQFRTWQPELS